MTFTCTSCGADVDINNPTCPKCLYQGNPGGAMPITAPISVHRVKSQVPLVIGIVIDRTASSKPYADGIHLILKLIFEEVTAKVNDVRVSIITYGDLELNEDTITLVDGVSPDAALDAAQNIVFFGGGDPPESHCDALKYALNNISWAADKSAGKNAIIALSTADTKPTQCGTTPAQIGKKMADKNILFFAAVEPFPFHQEIISTSNGYLFPISNSPSPEEISKVSSELGKTLSSIGNTGLKTEPMAPIN